MSTMTLEIRLPARTFAEVPEVTRIVAQTAAGAYGLLPRRLDCVAMLVPGILVYETTRDGEVCVAVDQGVLVKAGERVAVSVRDAIGGADLGALRAAVEREFARLDARERDVRAVMEKMESGFIRRMARFDRG